MHQGNQTHQDDIPPRSTIDSPAMGQRIYDTTRVVRTSQIAFIRNRLDQGLYPATVAGVAAVMAQMESQVQDPLLSISITSGFPGIQRSMTFQNGMWSGDDLTHHFHDDKASISYNLSSGGIHQNQSLQIPADAPLPPPPPVLTSLPTARAGEPPGSLTRQPPSAPPDLTNRPLADHAVISDLQAVTVNPHYSDFMRSMEQLWPELRQFTLPTVTFQNDNATNVQPAISFLHVNLLPEQEDIRAR